MLLIVSFEIIVIKLFSNPPIIINDKSLDIAIWLFITDFSSIVFDFMYLDIPVIFYRFDIDLDENTKDFESITFAANRDSYLYNCYYDEENTVNAIIKYINNGFVLEEENKEKNKVFYTYLERNNVCRNFVKIIDNINNNK